MTWRADGAGSGVDRMYHALVRHLPQQGVAVNGLALDAGEPSPSAIHTVASVQASLAERCIGVRRTARQILGATAPDLVATHFPLYALPVLDLVPPRPLVVHFHGPWAAEAAAEGESWPVVQAKRWIERCVYRRGTRFIVLSTAFQRVLTEDYGVGPSRIHVVPGGVDIKRFAVAASQHEARRRLGWPLHRPIVLSVRRLVRRVGLEPLIDAMRIVTQTVPDALLLIAGKGPRAEALQARIGAQGLADSVRLLGFVPDADLPLAYRAAHASVVPTQALEGFGLVAVESFAAGTPALVTPVGGLPEVVGPLSPDLVMADTTAEAIAARLIGVLRTTISVPEASTCRQYAADHFAWPLIAQQIRDVYHKVVHS